jgi:hypothetical protein
LLTLKSVDEKVSIHEKHFLSAKPNSQKYVTSLNAYSDECCDLYAYENTEVISIQMANALPHLMLPSSLPIRYYYKLCLLLLPTRNEYI